MLSSGEQLPLDYTPDWMALGIVSAEDIRRDAEELESGDDPYSEHYRWRAFSRFMAARETFPSQLAHQLYALGASDPEHSMGGSMMAVVLRHPECPLDLLKAALESDRMHLRRIAAKRLDARIPTE
jgi:hypothetical protein